ncbi:MAG: ABC transporter ATP-binding protein [Clostridiales bacterium]|nr:ABC transporter ATP-binding protein [Clostridiales bacterium]
MKMDIKNLSFSYGNHTVINNISFTIKDGEFLCILGPNGVGKSTLFRCILGLQKGFAGEILVNGTNLLKIPPKELAHHLAYIPQYANPVFSYTVFQLVLMGTTSQIGTFRHPKKREEERAMTALELLGIAHLKEKRASEISGGERQLTLIARAIAQNAHLLIMDEPTANLDYGNQVRVLQVIESLTKKGYSIMMSTHNPDQAFLYGTRVLMLKNGTILSQGSPKEALTEEVLQKAYGIEIGIKSFIEQDREYHLCIPTKRRIL